VKKVQELVSFSAQSRITSAWQTYSLNIEVLLVKFKTLHCDCFFMIISLWTLLLCTIYPLTCPTSENSLHRFRSSERRDHNPWLFIYHQKHIFKHVYNCLHCVPELRHRVCHNQQGFRTIWWGKFSQKHNYKYMAKWWCLLAMEKLHVSAYSGHLQVLTTFLLKEFYVICLNHVVMLRSHHHFTCFC